MRPRRMTRIARPLLPATVALSLLLAACAAGPGGSTGPIAHPSGDALVLRIAYRGGLPGPATLLTDFPVFTLTGDGRVIVPGAQMELFPGPALPAVNARRLTEEGIQAILDEVARTAIFGASIEYRGAQNMVMDASDTVFTLHADGREVEIVVYGLGTIDPAAQNAGISAAEIAAHGALMRLSERLMNPDGWLPASAWAEASWHPFEPEALRLIVRNADADPPDGSGIGNAIIDWPDGSDPLTFGDPAEGGSLRCGVVSGQEATDWYGALSLANQLTLFVKDDHRYQVMVRLMLPDEPLECPAQPA